MSGAPTFAFPLTLGTRPLVQGIHETALGIPSPWESGGNSQCLAFQRFRGWGLCQPRANLEIALMHPDSQRQRPTTVNPSPVLYCLRQSPPPGSLSSVLLFVLANINRDWFPYRSPHVPHQDRNR